MKVAIVQHESKTPAGSTIDWLKANNYEFQIYSIYEKVEFPQIENFDLFIICGGSMNVDQEDVYPWLKTEKYLIKSILASNKKILGLCLGAQLIAESLGARVQRHPHSEVGWQFVDFLPNKKLEFDQSLLAVFQYHSYSFELPPGADLIATNQACQNQGFLYKQNALGFQFHPESTKDWIFECAADKNLPSGTYCQDKEEIIEQIEFQENLQAWYFSCLDKFVALK